MAMIKPIGLSVPAFDATMDYTFQFQASGGEQVNYNRIIIRNNETNEEVYNNKIESYAYQQTVPANTLTNGTYYNYSFIVYDKNDNASEESTPISFYCYTTPVLNFTNIPEDNVIESSSFGFEFTYNQNEGELLNYIIVYLYDSNNNLISQSNYLYGSEILPNNFSYEFSGLIDDNSYFIQLEGKTINETVIYSDKIRFNVNYYYPEIFSLVDVTNDCENGNIHITNNTILVEGESSPNPPEYLDEEKINLNDYSDYVLWNKGYYIGDTFTLEAWLNPVLSGQTVKMYGDDENNYIELRLAREIPYGELEYKDILEMKYINNGKEEIYNFSDYISLINNLSDIIIWFRKKKGSTEVKLVETSHTDNILNLNEESNVEYNKLTDLKFSQVETSDFGYLVWNEVSDLYYNGTTNMFWNEDSTEEWTGNENIKTADKKESFYNNYNLENITNVIIRNGVYDHIDITKDINSEFSQTKPIWTYDTILDCDFNNTIYAGNVELALDQIDKIRIKRKKKDEFNWITLYEFDINKYEDLTFSYDDYFVPSGEEFEWAIVPVLSGNIEGSYNVNSLKTEFDGLFISDNSQTFKLYYGTSYSSNTSNNQIGTLQPYNSRYPIIISNQQVNYQTLTISGQLLGYDFTNNNKFILNRNSIVKQKDDFDSFIKNGKAKIFKDWNGNILLGSLTSQVNYSYNSNGGMMVPTVSFTLTEQGKYNSQEDMYENGLIEVIA